MTHMLKKGRMFAGNIGSNFVFYELNASVVEEVMLWLAGLREASESSEKKGWEIPMAVSSGKYLARKRYWSGNSKFGTEVNLIWKGNVLWRK